MCRWNIGNPKLSCDQAYRYMFVKVEKFQEFQHTIELDDEMPEDNTQFLCIQVGGQLIGIFNKR